MPITPMTTINPEYRIPEVGMIAGKKFWMNGNIPPKTVSNPIAIVTNFSVPKR